jgi:hypothetical protein
MMLSVLVGAGAGITKIVANVGGSVLCAVAVPARNPSVYMYQNK